MVEEGWSSIDVQLKRRANLIPNIINSVKGYMSHEKKLLEEITELRSQSEVANTVIDQGKAESSLSGSLLNLFAVSENYPELKANENFLDDTLNQEMLLTQVYLPSPTTHRQFAV